MCNRAWNPRDLPAVLDGNTAILWTEKEDERDAQKEKME